MPSVTRGSRRMFWQKPASAFVTSQKAWPSYSYQAGLTFGQPSSPTVPTLTKIFVSVRNACSSSGLSPRPLPSGNLPAMFRTPFVEQWSSSGSEEAIEAFERLLEDRALRRVTEPDRSFTAGAEGGAGSEADPLLDEESAAESERIV